MLLDQYYVRGEDTLEVPVHLNFGKYMLTYLLQMGDKVAMINGTTDEKITYKEFAQYSVNLANSLINLGIGKGDVIAVGSEKQNYILPTILSVIFTGATCTPYDVDSGHAVLRHKLSIAKPTYFICSKLFWERHEEDIKSVNTIKGYFAFDDSPQNATTIKSLVSDDVDITQFEPAKVVGQLDTAIILYSSGTTGMPKGVLLTHYNCILSCLPDIFKRESLQTAYIFGLWSHNYDIFMSYKILAAGKKFVHINDITPENVLACIEKYKVNIAMFVPSFLSLIAKEENLEKYDLSSLQLVYSRAFSLLRSTIDNVKERLPKLQYIYQGYGMTECGEPTSDKWATKGPKTGSIGMAAPGVIIKIVDLETDKNLGPNKTGEIRVTAPMLMKGYIDKDPSTYLDEEGFFKTGDLGYYDSDNYLYITDRIKDIINYTGFKVAPAQLESILEMHPAVLEAGVIGTPDVECGELPTAFVVKKANSNITEKELVDYVATQVDPYMQLKGGVKFIPKLPRSARGKLLRRQLREMLN